MSVIDELITDRTKEDIYEGTPKGKYDYVDYNRVGRAINYVANEIGGLSITAKTNWVNTDIPRDSDITAYRGYVQTIVDTVGSGYPVPTTNNAVLTITGANQIEQALYGTYQLVLRVMRWQDLNNLQETWDMVDLKYITWGEYFLKPQ